MAYTVEKLDNEPIVLIRMLTPLNPVEELANLYRETDALTANIPGKIYRIVDWTEAQLTFDLVMELLDTQRKSNAASAPKRPRVKNHYVVSGKWDRFMIESLAQPQYGGVDALMFSSITEAIATVCKTIKCATVELPLAY